MAFTLALFFSQSVLFSGLIPSPTLLFYFNIEFKNKMADFSLLSLTVSSHVYFDFVTFGSPHLPT